MSIKTEIDCTISASLSRVVELFINNDCVPRGKVKDAQMKVVDGSWLKLRVILEQTDEDEYKEDEDEYEEDEDDDGCVDLDNGTYIDKEDGEVYVKE